MEKGLMPDVDAIEITDRNHSVFIWFFNIINMFN